MSRETFERIAEAIENVANAKGTISKQYLLREYASIKGFKEVMEFIYNPYIITGIARTSLHKGAHGIMPKEPISYVDIIEYLKANNTGSDAAIFKVWQFINYSGVDNKVAEKLAISMVTKDLKIGVTATTLNKVYGSDFIPIIDLMLGKSYKDYKHKVLGPFIITEKLDGHRRLIIKEKGNISIYTRSGIKDEGLIHIEAEAQALPDNTVYDGEALAIGTFRNALELRQATNSIMNSKGIRTGVTFNIFDMLPVSEFKAGKSSQPAYVRKAILCKMFNDSSSALLSKIYVNPIKELEYVTSINNDMDIIRNVPILGTAYNERSVIDFAKPIWDAGFEGVMALQKDSKYELKRSNNLLKVKATETLELPIIDFIEGTGKYTGMLGSFIVDYKGFPVGVGSGLTDADRDTFWSNRDSLVGKKIEINTFGETKNMDGSLSLNCGIFKGIRHDK